MTVTAVVCGGWEQRKKNVERIVTDLLSGTVVPERIIVLDNTESPDSVSPFNTLAGEVVKIIRSFNTECHGKFVAALFAPADYYLLADDDTSVSKRTVECLVRFAQPGFVTGYWGVRLTNGSFAQGEIIAPGLVGASQRVDAFHGRILFMAHDALVRMFEAEGQMRTSGDLTGDDILAGLANPGSVIVPMAPDENFVNLSECGVAMCNQEGYFEERDSFTRRALEVLR